jgi:hypothetical protein
MSQDQNSDLESLHEQIDDILIAAETSRHSSGLNCTVTKHVLVETKADVSREISKTKKRTKDLTGI